MLVLWTTEWGLAKAINGKGVECFAGRKAESA